MVGPCRFSRRPLAGVWFGSWLQRKQLKEEAAARRRDQAAAALAPVKALLFDAEPVRLTLFNAEQHLQQDLPRLVDEWRKGREALLQMSIGHPSSDVRKLAEETEKAVTNSFTSATVFLEFMIKGMDSKSSLDVAKQDQAEARHRLEALSEAIRKG